MTFHPEPRNGIFITFEGIEGSGKSKHIAVLCEELSKAHYPVMVTREPGGTRIGEKIRDLILDPEFSEMKSSTELLLYLASRAQHLHEQIFPALHENKIVLCDRFHDSTFAYQGGGRGIELQVIESLIQNLFHNIKPHLTILLDLPPRLALDRIKNRTGFNRIDAENLAFHETVRSNYLTLVQREPNRFRVVNSLLDFAEAHREVLAFVMALLKEERYAI